MLKDFLWNAFIHAGSIDAYMFYREIEEKDKAFIERIAAEEEVAISNT